MFARPGFRGDIEGVVVRGSSVVSDNRPFVFQDKLDSKSVGELCVTVATAEEDLVTASSFPFDVPCTNSFVISVMVPTSVAVEVVGLSPEIGVTKKSGTFCISPDLTIS